MAVKPITIEGLKSWSTDNPTLIADDQVSDAQNMVIDTDGLWTNRLGIKSFANPIVAGDHGVDGMKFWLPSAGGSRLFVAAVNGALYNYTEGSEYNNGTFASVQTGFTAGEPFEFAIYKDGILATNGEENMFDSTDNVTWTERTSGVGDAIKAKYIIFAQDTGYGWDTPGARSLLSYSATVPANRYALGANNVEVDEDNGFVATGITNLGPLVVAFKGEGIYNVNIASSTITPLDTDGGCVAHRSIVKAANDVYFASEEGFRKLSQRQATTGSLHVTELSEPIDGFWSTVINKDQIVGKYYPATRQIYWFVQTLAGAVTLVYNLRWKVWSYYTGINPGIFDRYVDSDGNQHLIFGDKDTNAIREMEYIDRSDDGAPILSVLATKAYNFGTNHTKKIDHITIQGFASELYELDIDVLLDDNTVVPARSITIDKNYFTDVDVTGDALADTELGSSSLATSAQASLDLPIRPWEVRIIMERPFRNVQVRLTNAQAGVKWKLQSMVFQVDSQPIAVFNKDRIV